MYTFILLMFICISCYSYRCCRNEARANELLGPISLKEDAEIQERLGVTRDNRLLFLFGIHASDRSVTIAHREAHVKRASKKVDKEVLRS
jgi:cbb3-type cytochrome oxidase subunit 3